MPANITSANAPLARRPALPRALDAPPDEAARRDLVAAAADVELADTLAKAKSLSGAARRQHLEAAIAAIRADNMPEALQAAELAQLEAAAVGA